MAKCSKPLHFNEPILWIKAFGIKIWKKKSIWFKPMDEITGLTRPINRAPLGHTRFYCQGALFPWPDKTCNQFQIQFFIISRRHHSKWFGRYITHISDHALTLKQNMNRPLIPDSYPFLFAAFTRQSVWYGIVIPFVLDPVTNQVFHYWKTIPYQLFAAWTLQTKTIRGLRRVSNFRPLLLS